jgi:hypothetical protein
MSQIGIPNFSLTLPLGSSSHIFSLPSLPSTFYSLGFITLLSALTVLTLLSLLSDFYPCRLRSQGGNGGFRIPGIPRIPMGFGIPKIRRFPLVRSSLNLSLPFDLYPCRLGSSLNLSSPSDLDRCCL